MPTRPPQSQFVTQAIAIARTQYADIARLTPTDDIAPDVATYLEQGDRSVAMSQDLYSAGFTSVTARRRLAV